MKSRAIGFAFVLSLVAMLPGAVRADVIIDDFSNPTQLSVFGAAGSSNAGTFPASPGAPVATRDMTVLITLNNGSLLSGAHWTTGPASNTANFSTDSGLMGIFQLGYGDALGGAPLNLDLSGLVQFEFDARADNLVDAEFNVNGIPVPFQIPGTPIGVFTHFVFPFALFPGLVPSDIDGILFSIGGAPGGSEVDGQLDNFQASVPEPASAIVLGASLVGAIGLVARRRRNAK